MITIFRERETLREKVKNMERQNENLARRCEELEARLREKDALMATPMITIFSERDALRETVKVMEQQKAELEARLREKGALEQQYERKREELEARLREKVNSLEHQNENLARKLKKCEDQCVRVEVKLREKEQQVKELREKELQVSVKATTTKELQVGATKTKEKEEETTIAPLMLDLALRDQCIEFIYFAEKYARIPPSNLVKDRMVKKYINKIEAYEKNSKELIDKFNAKNSYDKTVHELLLRIAHNQYMIDQQMLKIEPLNSTRISQSLNDKLSDAFSELHSFSKYCLKNKSDTPTITYRKVNVQSMLPPWLDPYKAAEMTEYDNYIYRRLLNNESRRYVSEEELVDMTESEKSNFLYRLKYHDADIR